ncbi:hypothetical protein HK096_000272 [Nowakowskiella sp. JEL0078]|nr:hypothetical protein HK096_000272 [Nowakowskiella sp. JEL0078]
MQDKEPQEGSPTAIKRYSRELLLALRDSPLVAKPADLPNIELLAKDPEHRLPSSALPLEIDSKPAKTARSFAPNFSDRHYLGPPKSNFPSSQSSPSKNDDFRNSRLNRTNQFTDSRSESTSPSRQPAGTLRQPRAPSTPGQRDTRENTRSSPNSNTKPTISDKRANGRLSEKTNIKGSTGRRENDKDDRRRDEVPGRPIMNRATSNYAHPKRHDDNPEWMDDIPATDTAIGSSTVAGELDEMQKYRAQMKAEEKLARESSAPKGSTPPEPSPAVVNQPKPDVSIGASSSIPVQGIDDMFATSFSKDETPAPKESKSRFTKFFKNEDAEKSTLVRIPAPPSESKFIGVGESTTPATGSPSLFSKAEATLTDPPKRTSPVNVLSFFPPRVSEPFVKQQVQQPKVMYEDEVIRGLGLPRDLPQSEREPDDFTRILSMFSRQNVSNQPSNSSPRLSSPPLTQKQFQQQQYVRPRPSGSIQSPVLTNRNVYGMEAPPPAPHDASAQIMAMLQNSINAKKSASVYEERNTGQVYQNERSNFNGSQYGGHHTQGGMYYNAEESAMAAAFSAAAAQAANSGNRPGPSPGYFGNNQSQLTIQQQIQLQQQQQQQQQQIQQQELGRYYSQQQQQQQPHGQHHFAQQQSQQNLLYNQMTPGNLTPQQQMILMAQQQQEIQYRQQQQQYIQQQLAAIAEDYTNGRR